MKTILLIDFKVRAVVGHTYLLNQNEELWKKELPDAVEKLLALGKDPLADRGSMTNKGG